MTWKILDEDSKPLQSNQELSHDQLFEDLD